MSMILMMTEMISDQGPSFRQRALFFKSKSHSERSANLLMPIRSKAAQDSE